MARRDNSEIFTLTDLVGKRIASRAISSLPAMLMQWRELIVAGVEPLVDVHQVRFVPNDNPEVKV